MQKKLLKTNFITINICKKSTVLTQNETLTRFSKHFVYILYLNSISEIKTDNLNIFMLKIHRTDNVLIFTKRVSVNCVNKFLISDNSIPA